MRTSNIQFVTCTIRPKRQKIAFGCLYRAPQATPDEDDELLTKMEELLRSAPKVIILGDFNLPEINWQAASCRSATAGHRFISWMHGCALTQLISEPTRFRSGQCPSILDSVITNSPALVEEVSTKPLLGKSDHVVITALVRVSYRKPECKMVRHFNRMDQLALQQAAALLAWVPGAFGCLLETR